MTQAAPARRCARRRVAPWRSAWPLLGLAAWLLGAVPAPGVLPLGLLQETPAPAGLLGSEIGDIRWSGRYLWVATESGLARLEAGRQSGLQEADWVTFTQAQGLSRGAVAALAASGDTVWAATVYDSLVAGVDQVFQVGDGLVASFDAGATWQHIRNGTIFNPRQPDFEDGPSFAIQNGCFGVSFHGSTVWAAFFAGSTVRSRDAGRTWERVLPDGARRIVFTETPLADSVQAIADSLIGAGGDPREIARLLAAADSMRQQAGVHRTFEVLTAGDTVWVGTAAGLTRSFDGGRTWKVIPTRLDADSTRLPGSLPGNWVLTLERQILPDGRPVLWAGTGVTRTGEANGLALSYDHGETWQVVGPQSTAWGFAFAASRIFAATDQGLVASADQGATWAEVEVRDATLGQQLRGTFVGAAVAAGVVWVGAENGVARSADEGETWQIIESPVKPLSVDRGAVVGEAGVVDSVRTYAAPNPFAPSREGEEARIHYALSEDARVTIRIYDFASRLVRTLIEEEPKNGPQLHGQNWDGRNDAGAAVANGVYFYRVELDSGQQAFGKVVVLE
ncbi:MAG: FlgD immunoglobulin-like domain containing protein [Candidatus Latescibacterota bacterium]